MEFTDKMQRCHDYVEALQEEKRKILVFQRELPLCLELVTQAIEACKRELSGTTTDYMHGQSECSEQTSSEGPVLEEFMPIKRTPSCSDNDEGNEDEDEDEEDERERQKSQSKRYRSSSSNKDNHNSSNGDLKKKSDWLRSVQLWSQSPDPSPEEDGPKKAVVTEVKRNGGAFQPFQKEKSSSNEKRSNISNNNNNQTVGKTATSTVPASAASSTAQTTAGGNSGGGNNGRKEEKEGQQQRKHRRCWSPELHRRFLHALQQLGGSHAATPKQIRELMKVDGLTNDEVKSHLQKYRLHTRRPTPAIHNNNHPQTPQFVVVGGIWMPPPEYAAVAATTSAETAATNAIYAPVAAPPPSITQLSTSVLQNEQNSQVASEGRGSHSEGGVHSNSPSTSSSTHTTTNSPNF